MLNVYEQVDANKRRSALIIAAFIFFVVGFIWLAGKLLGADQGMIIGAAFFSLFSAISSYLWGDKIILSLSRAKPASRSDHFNFYTAVENIALAAQIPVPKLYVIEDPAMNAFATGRDPKHAVVCATTGLLENLNKSELEGVVAHEVSHIVNYDILLMTLVAVLVGMVTLLSDWLIRLTRFGSRDDNRERANPVALVIGLLALIISPLVAKLIQLAISRRREYLADAAAVKLTRQPQGLINALRKLAQTAPLRLANQATAHLFIVNPFRGMRGGLRRLAAIFTTHPPIEERIARLQKML